MDKSSEISPKEVLKKYWGFEAFRLKQEEIISSVMSGRDTLALLPTGGGKSICFQVPVLCREGLGLVISPLVALMQDQVDSLNRKGIRAFAITSFMSKREMDIVLDNCIYGKVKFLYVSPERLQNEMFRVRLAKMKVNLIAVDEAHCISQWGYDFRPSYLKIEELRKIKPGISLLALTASATPKVVDDIQDKLSFPKKNVIGSSFERKNLVYVVYKVEDKEAKLLEVCRNVTGQGVVYCGTRNRTKETAAFLKKNRIPAVYYHAGMTQAERNLASQSWFNGKQRVICATNAFGMGIDKPDVRFVVHMDVPSDPEAYFQEAGRAGRDGAKAYALLMYSQADVENIQQKTTVQFPPLETIQAVYRAVCNHLQLASGAGEGQVYSLDLVQVCKSYSLSYTESYFSMLLLERAGYIAMNESWHEPSRLFICVNRAVLYDYQVANPAMDGFIKLLLRMYGGLFEHFVNIREDDIAKHLKTTKADVLEKLKMLAKHGLVEFHPNSNEPKISFIQPRIREQHIRMPAEIYADRKKSAIDRAKSMIRYMETQRCRSIQLLEYFGERDAVACGRCDVCSHKKQSGLELEEFEEMTKQVVEKLLQSPRRPEDLPQLLPQFNKEHLLQLVRWKIDQEEWELNEKMFIRITNL